MMQRACRKQAPCKNDAKGPDGHDDATSSSLLLLLEGLRAGKWSEHICRARRRAESGRHHLGHSTLVKSQQETWHCTRNVISWPGPATMIRVWTVAGEELAQVPAEELTDATWALRFFHFLFR